MKDTVDHLNEISGLIAPADLPAEVELGAVFTLPQVVGFMLDGVGLSSGANWQSLRILEPSCGDGAFLVELARRMAGSQDKASYEDLADRVVAVELDAGTARAARSAVARALCGIGMPMPEAQKVSDNWVVEGDFLDLAPSLGEFTHVVGNPPYIRIENIAPAKLASYRKSYGTMLGRADIFVAFYEAGLERLASGGALSFICANRWMKNAYGKGLRKLVSSKFLVDQIIDVQHTECFRDGVSAYPAITVFRRGEGLNALARISAFSSGPFDLGAQSEETGLPQAIFTDEPWNVDRLDLARIEAMMIENSHPIEQAGCRVGVGVATGANAVFCVKKGSVDVEASRLLPLVSRENLQNGAIQSVEEEVINVFGDDGKLIDLAAFPKLAAYFASHEGRLRARHVAKKRPDAWYRTIDKITMSVVDQPKILIGDISRYAEMAIAPAGLCPDHNLYFLTSQEWDLRALYNFLGSGVLDFFVSLHSVQMRGGNYRFQAQTLRKVHIPRWNDLSPQAQAYWSGTDRSRDEEEIADAYDIGSEAAAVIRGCREGAAT